MDSASELASINVIRRREFVDSFVLEIILNMHRKEIAKEVGKEIENELLRKIEEQNKEIERIKRIEEARFITRQFMPSIINPILQAEQVSVPQVPVPAELQEKTEEKPLTIGSRIDPLFLGDIKTIECVNGNVRIKKNQEFEETEIVLSENEIRDVAKKFSEMTKIPIVDNVLRASLNNFTIAAIISDKIGSRFLIQKTS